MSKANWPLRWTDLSRDEQTVLASLPETTESFTTASDALVDKGLMDADGQTTKRGQELIQAALRDSYIQFNPTCRYVRRRESC